MMYVKCGLKDRKQVVNMQWKCEWKEKNPATQLKEAGLEVLPSRTWAGKLNQQRNQLPSWEPVWKESWGLLLTWLVSESSLTHSSSQGQACSSRDHQGGSMSSLPGDLAGTDG